MIITSRPDGKTISGNVNNYVAAANKLFNKSKPYIERILTLECENQEEWQKVLEEGKAEVESQRECISLKKEEELEYVTIKTNYKYIPSKSNIFYTAVFLKKLGIVWIIYDPDIDSKERFEKFYNEIKNAINENNSKKPLQFKRN